MKKIPTAFVRLLLVSAGGVLAGHEDGGSGALLAGAIAEGVQDAGYGGVSGDDPQDYDGQDCEKEYESYQQTTQVRPTFPLVAAIANSRILFRDQV